MTNLDYLCNPDAVKERFDENYFVDKQLGFSVIENGTILPHKEVQIVKGWSWKNQFGGILDGNGEYVKGSHVASSIHGAYEPPPLDYPQLRNRRLSRYVCQHVGARHN